MYIQIYTHRTIAAALPVLLGSDVISRHTAAQWHPHRPADTALPRRRRAGTYSEPPYAVLSTYNAAGSAA